MNFTFALEQFELFVLILIRLASFVFAAPFFNMANVPRKVKAGFALCLTVLVYSLFPDMTVEYNGMIDYAIIVVEEMIVGILLGAVTSFCVQIIMFAGKIIDMDIGISMAQLYDPTTRMQVGIMGNFYYYMMMLLLIISGMHQYLVAAIVETYKVIPIGGVKFGAGIYTAIISFMSDFFVIGFRIALPVFSAILMLNCVLAILAKVSPQMNMFVVGMQRKGFVGLVLLFLTMQLFAGAADFLFDEMHTFTKYFVQAMAA